MRKLRITRSGFLCILIGQLAGGSAIDATGLVSAPVPFGWPRFSSLCLVLGGYVLYQATSRPKSIAEASVAKS